MPTPLSRRTLLRASTATGLAALAGCASRPRPAPTILTRGAPSLASGVASGDITPDSAIIWSRSDIPARMHVEWSTVESFKDSRTILGPDATPATDLTAKLDLRDLPPNQRIFYRVRFMSLADPTRTSAPATGTFRTAPLAARPIRFAWSADTAGQGWGIDPNFGGMRIYETIRRMSPDFFVHSGDTIYADIPIPPEQKTHDGRTWKNITTPAKSVVAQTLDEFRGNHAYNLLDENVRRFNASIPVIAQWDDHEVHNNWWPGQVLDDDRYTVRETDILAPRARQAFFEYLPIRPGGGQPGRIYRSFAFGPAMDLFVLDARSYRGANSPNRQKELSPESAFFGDEQVRWLIDQLGRSKAVWKVIACDMPIGVVAGDLGRYEAVANSDPGQPLGRELEIAQILSFLRERKIRNTLWITADLHSPMSIEYHPDRAAWKEFDPFWEFVTGPLHAGTYGPYVLDRTFGPRYEFSAPPKVGGLGPAAGLQYFAMVDIAPDGSRLTITQHDIDGREIHRNDLAAIL